jgi:hypothetical protein
VVTPGNHDIQGNAWATELFAEAFPELPSNGPAGFERRAYVLDYRDVRFIKVGVAEMAPVVLVALRLIVATLLLLGALYLRGLRFPVRLRSWGDFLFTGVVGLVLPYLLITWGEQHIASHKHGHISAAAIRAALWGIAAARAGDIQRTARLGAGGRRYSAREQRVRAASWPVSGCLGCETSNVKCTT